MECLFQWYFAAHPRGHGVRWLHPCLFLWQTGLANHNVLQQHGIGKNCNQELILAGHPGSWKNRRCCSSPQAIHPRQKIHLEGRILLLQGSISILRVKMTQKFPSLAITKRWKEIQHGNSAIFGTSPNCWTPREFKYFTRHKYALSWNTPHSPRSHLCRWQTAKLYKLTNYH